MVESSMPSASRSIAASAPYRSKPPSSRWHLAMAIFALVGVISALAAIGALTRFAPACAAAMVLGKLIILKGALPQNSFGFTAWDFALLVASMDVWVGYVLVYQTDLLRRLPRVGPWLGRLQDFGEYWIHRNSWIRRWAFVGVAVFVLIPITGTGAAGGSVLARLMGLRPRTTLFAIATGAVCGCSLLAAFAAPLRPRFEGLKDDPLFQVVSYAILAAIVLGFFWLGHRVNQAARRYEIHRHSVPPEA